MSVVSYTAFGGVYGFRKDVERLMVAIVKAFGAKICSLPTSMRRKDVRNYLTMSEEMQYLRDSCTDNPQLLWVVVKIVVPFWVPIIIRHLIFKVPKKGP